MDADIGSVTDVMNWTLKMANGKLYVTPRDTQVCA